MIIYYYLLIPPLFLLVDSSSIRSRYNKNELVPLTSSRVDRLDNKNGNHNNNISNSNDLKVVSNEPFIIQFPVPKHSDSKQTEKDKKRKNKKRVSRKKHRTRRDLRFSRPRHTREEKSEIQITEKATEGRNKTKNSIHPSEVLKALKSYHKNIHIKRSVPLGDFPETKNATKRIGKITKTTENQPNSHLVRMKYPNTPKQDRHSHKYNYKDLMADRKRLEQKINYVKNMLNTNDSSTDDPVRIRRRSESDRTANKIAKMFLTLSAVNGLHDKRRTRCNDYDDDDGDRVQDVWEKERRSSPNRISSSSNAERYKIKKWIEFMKNKRSSGKTCPCMASVIGEDSDAFPLEQKLPKDYFLTERRGSSEESSEIYREPYYPRDKPNYRRRYKGQDGQDNKLKALGKNAKKKLDLPLTDLELYRSRAKQILQNAEDILDKIKEEEEKRLSAPSILMSQLKELTSRIQSDPRNNENDLIRKLQKNLGWKPLAKSKEGSDGNTFVDNVKSFILDPYEKAKALTDESTKMLSSYLLRNLGKIQESSEEQAVDDKNQQVYFGQVPTNEEDKPLPASLSKEPSSSPDLLSRTKQELENWEDTISTIMRGPEENEPESRLKQEQIFKTRMEDIMKEQQKILNGYETSQTDNNSKETDTSDSRSSDGKKTKPGIKFPKPERALPTRLKQKEGIEKDQTDKLKNPGHLKPHKKPEISKIQLPKAPKPEKDTIGGLPTRLKHRNGTENEKDKADKLKNPLWGHLKPHKAGKGSRVQPQRAGKSSETKEDAVTYPKETDELDREILEKSIEEEEKSFGSVAVEQDPRIEEAILGEEKDEPVQATLNAEDLEKDDAEQRPEGVEIQQIPPDVSGKQEITEEDDKPETDSLSGYGERVEAVGIEKELPDYDLLPGVEDGRMDENLKGGVGTPQEDLGEPTNEETLLRSPEIDEEESLLRNAERLHDEIMEKATDFENLSENDKAEEVLEQILERAEELEANLEAITDHKVQNPENVEVQSANQESLENTGSSVKDNKQENVNEEREDGSNVKIEHKDVDETGETFVEGVKADLNQRDSTEEEVGKSELKMENQEEDVKSSLKNSNDSEEVKAVLDDEDGKVDVDGDAKLVKSEADGSESVETSEENLKEVLEKKEGDEIREDMRNKGDDVENETSLREVSENRKEEEEDDNEDETPLREALEKDDGEDGEIPLRKSLKNEEDDEASLTKAFENSKEEEEDDETALGKALNDDEREDGEMPLRKTIENEKEDEEDETSLRKGYQNSKEDEIPLRKSLEDKDEEDDDVTQLRNSLESRKEEDDDEIRSGEALKSNERGEDEIPLRNTLENSKEEKEDEEGTPLRKTLENKDEDVEIPLRKDLGKSKEEEEEDDDDDETLENSKEEETPLRQTLKNSEEGDNETPLKKIPEKKDEGEDVANPLIEAPENSREEKEEREESPLRSALENTDEGDDEIPLRKALGKSKEENDDETLENSKEDETPLRKALGKSKEDVNETPLTETLENKNEGEDVANPLRKALKNSREEKEEDETPLKKALDNNQEDDDEIPLRKTMKDKEVINDDDEVELKMDLKNEDERELLEENKEDEEIPFGETLKSEDPLESKEREDGTPLREENDDVESPLRQPLTSEEDEEDDPLREVLKNKVENVESPLRDALERKEGEENGDVPLRGVLKNEEEDVESPLGKKAEENSKEIPLKSKEENDDVESLLRNTLESQEEDNGDDVESPLKEVTRSKEENDEDVESPLRNTLDSNEENDGETPLREALKNKEDNVGDVESPLREVTTSKEDENDDDFESPLRNTLESQEDNGDDVESPLREITKSKEDENDDGVESPLKNTLESNEENDGETPVREASDNKDENLREENPTEDTDSLSSGNNAEESSNSEEDELSKASINLKEINPENVAKETSFDENQSRPEEEENELRATRTENGDETPLQATIKERESGETPLESANLTQDTQNSYEENLESVNLIDGNQVSNENEGDETSEEVAMNKQQDENGETGDDPVLKSAENINEEENTIDGDEVALRADEDTQQGAQSEETSVEKSGEVLRTALEEIAEDTEEVDDDDDDNDDQMSLKSIKNSNEETDRRDDEDSLRATLGDAESVTETNDRATYQKGDSREEENAVGSVGGERNGQKTQYSDEDEAPFKVSLNPLEETSEEVQEMAKQTENEEDDFRSASLENELDSKIREIPLKSGQTTEETIGEARSEETTEDENSSEENPLGILQKAAEENDSEENNRLLSFSDLLQAPEGGSRTGKLKVPKSIAQIMKNLEGKDIDDVTALNNLDPDKIDDIIGKIGEIEQQHLLQEHPEVDCRKECACADQIETRSRNIGRYEIVKDFLHWMKDLQLNRVLTD